MIEATAALSPAGGPDLRAAVVHPVPQELRAARRLHLPARVRHPDEEPVWRAPLRGAGRRAGRGVSVHPGRARGRDLRGAVPGVRLERVSLQRARLVEGAVPHHDGGGRLLHGELQRRRRLGIAQALLAAPGVGTKKRHACAASASPPPHWRPLSTPARPPPRASTWWRRGSSCRSSCSSGPAPC